MNRAQTIRTEDDARRAFWAQMPWAIRRHYVRCIRQNAYPADVRVAWCDWVDAAARDGLLSEELARTVTL